MSDQLYALASLSPRIKPLLLVWTWQQRKACAPVGNITLVVHPTTSHFID